jgi:asparagine synthase (glutamine-hydrolysing)
MPGSIDAMSKAMSHRGPDDGGTRTWDDQGVALAHRRLSIVDLSPAGRNPMPNEDGTVWVVHNGEIYNHLELRRELERLGHRFASAADTEVLVHGYEEWGDDLVHRLRGMFAFAIYDRRLLGGRVLLVRDRLGIKPLYVGADGARLVFGSELPTVLAAGGIDRRPDLVALADFLRFQCVPAPRTAYVGVRALPPGSMLVLEGGRAIERRWWELPVDASSSASPAEVTAMIRDRLIDAVDAHRLADVPVGLFLSGGVDSSAVAAVLRSATADPLQAFTIGFDVGAHSEVGFAREVADHLGFEHHVRDVGVGDVESALDSVLTMHGQPFADGSALPTRRVSELAADHVKVALSGDGGDEVFAGYPRYARWMRTLAVDRAPGPVRTAASAALRTLPRTRQVAWLGDLDHGNFERYARMVSLFHPDEVEALAGPVLRAALPGDPYESLRRFWREDLDPLTRVQFLDLHTYLPDDILTKVDRASMAVGLEVRPPLLDHELVEAVMALPPSLRVPDGDPKGLLKAAVRDLVPPGTFDRPKQGFSAPWNAWMQELGTWAGEQVRDGAAVASGIVDPRAFSVADADLARRGPKLWSLLVLEHWCRANP